MIDFFSGFPSVPYSQDGFYKEAANIAIGEVMVHNKIDSSYILWKKELFDDDTPVSVSDEVYHDTQYYWTILYVNNIINPYTDWYMSQSEHEDYVQRKYGDKYALHHFERRELNKDPVNLDDIETAYELAKWQSHQPQSLYIFPVTNLDYERNINDARRTITIISPKFIGEFAEEFRKIVSSK